MHASLTFDSKVGMGGNRVFVWMSEVVCISNAVQPLRVMNGAEFHFCVLIAKNCVSGLEDKNGPKKHLKWAANAAVQHTQYMVSINLGMLLNSILSVD